MSTLTTPELTDIALYMFKGAALSQVSWRNLGKLPIPTLIFTAIVADLVLHICAVSMVQFKDKLSSRGTQTLLVIYYLMDMLDILAASYAYLLRWYALT